MKFHMISGGPKPVAPFSHAVESDGFVFVTPEYNYGPSAVTKTKPSDCAIAAVHLCTTSFL